MQKNAIRPIDQEKIKLLDEELMHATMGSTTVLHIIGAYALMCVVFYNVIHRLLTSSSFVLVAVLAMAISYVLLKFPVGPFLADRLIKKFPGGTDELKRIVGVMDDATALNMQLAGPTKLTDESLASERTRLAELVENEYRKLRDARLEREKSATQ